MQSFGPQPPTMTQINMIQQELDLSFQNVHSIRMERDAATVVVQQAQSEIVQLRTNLDSVTDERNALNNTLNQNLIQINDLQAQLENSLSLQKETADSNS